MIVQAISASKEKQLSSSEILNYVTETHPEYTSEAKVLL